MVVILPPIVLMVAGISGTNFPNPFGVPGVSGVRTSICFCSEGEVLLGIQQRRSFGAETSEKPAGGWLTEHGPPDLRG